MLDGAGRGKTRAFDLCGARRNGNAAQDCPVPPLKSISVTPTRRAGGRKQPSPTIAEEFGDSFSTQAAALARPARRTAPAPTHRYRVGDKLRMNGGGQSLQRAASSCKVIALLPYEGHGALLYRVRSDTESFERVVAEADLGR
jgi:hypothetical protein